MAVHESTLMVRTRQRASTWFAVAILVGCYGMVTFSVASVFLPGGSLLPDRPTIGSFVAVCCIFIAVPTVGAVLAILRPANPIGWLYLVIGVGFTMGIFSTEYVGRATYTGVNLPGVALVEWIGLWSGVLSVGLALIWVPLLFPDGHLPGRRWRPVALAAAISLGLSTLSIAILPDSDPANVRVGLAPLGAGGPILEIASVVNAIPIMPILGVLAFVSVFVRFRRSTGIERQQLKWFLFVVGALLVAVIVAFATELEATWYAVMLGLAALPVATAIAILRYRLYEIDRLVSRSIAYAAVTGGLVAVYLVVNLGLTTLFSSLTRGDSVAVAASTLVVAALFTPVRRRVRRVVDGRFDRARYDGERTAAEFSERLRNEIDIASVSADLSATVRVAISPSTVGLWLRTGTT